jgi:hypothetical protein
MRLPPPALAVSLIALIVALGGTGYAITQIPAGSVGSAQLRNGAVTSAKVRDGSLRAEDFRRGELATGRADAVGATGPRGERGVQGERGPQGERGLRGPAGTSVSGGAQLLAFSSVGGSVSDPVLPEGWSAPVVSAIDAGVFELAFDRALSGCTPVATSGFDTEEVYPRVVTVDSVAGDPAKLMVRVTDTEGFPAATDDFRFMLACPG